jgi:hypothetical protein
MEMQPRFVARGTAVAFAGRVTRLGGREVNQLVDVPGNSASLPVTGGLSRGETGRFALFHDHTWPHPLVSMASGATRAWTDGPERAPVTHVMATVDQLAIAGRFFVERGASYLRSTYRRGANEPDLSIHDSSLSGLRCDEHAIDVRWRTDILNKAPNYGALQKAWTRAKAGDTLDRHILRAPETARRTAKSLPAMKGYVLATVCELAWADKPHPEVTLDGHVVRWPGFGTVYVGEMLISPHVRRLTLLRFDLGSPFAMEASSIEVESDGIGLP